MALTPQEYAKKWKERMTNSVPDIVSGIDKVTENPCQKAAQNSEKWLFKLNQSKNRFEKGLNEVTLTDWKEKAKTKVQARLSQGVQGAEAKMTKFGNYLIPTVAQSKSNISSMPSNTLEDNIARMTAHVRFMAQNPYKGQ